MISVIIPTHNRADLLFFELEHIYKQRDVEIEVIVVNDIEEKDATDEITILFPKVRYIKSSKIQGPSEKHKAGLRIANGDYLYIPDDDDFLTDEFFFKKAVEILEKDKTLAFVSGGVNMRYEHSDGSLLKKVRQNINVNGYIDGLIYLQEFQHQLSKPASTVSTIFRKKAFEDMDAVNMKECSDSSMYMLSLLWGGAYIMDDIVAEYRIRQRGSSLTTTLSIPFVMNVFAQKEDLFFASKGKLKAPKNFWFNQVRCTFGFFSASQNKKLDKFKVLLWCLCHSHGSAQIIYYVICRGVRLLCSK